MESDAKERVSLDELQGWRTTEGDEKKYIEGYLLYFAKRSKIQITGQA